MPENEKPAEVPRIIGELVLNLHVSHNTDLNITLPTEISGLTTNH